MRQRMARPNLKEVASAAGVSTQTLLRVINKRPDVSPETRKRVQAVIEALGYKPGVPASGWISQRSYTLGIVTAGLEYIGPSRLLKELPLSDKYNIRPIFQALLSRQVDGLIWAVPEVEHIIKIKEEGWQGNNQVNPQTILLSPNLTIRRSSLRRKEQEVNPSRVTSI